MLKLVDENTKELLNFKKWIVGKKIHDIHFSEDRDGFVHIELEEIGCEGFNTTITFPTAQLMYSGNPKTGGVFLEVPWDD